MIDYKQFTRPSQFSFPTQISIGQDETSVKPGAVDYSMVDIPGAVSETLTSASELFKYTVGVPIGAVGSIMPQPIKDVVGTAEKGVADIVGGIANIGANLVGGALDLLTLPAKHVEAFLAERNLEAARRSPNAPAAFDPFLPLSILGLTKAKDVLPAEILAQLKFNPNADLRELAWKAVESGKPFGDDFAKNLFGLLVYDPLLVVPFGKVSAAARALGLTQAVSAPARLLLAFASRIPVLDALTNSGPVVSGFLRSVGQKRYISLSKVFEEAAPTANLSPQVASEFAEAAAYYNGFLHNAVLAERLGAEMSLVVPEMPLGRMAAMSKMSPQDVKEYLEAIGISKTVGRFLNPDNYNTFEDVAQAIAKRREDISKMGGRAERMLQEDVEKFNSYLRTYVVPNSLETDIKRAFNSEEGLILRKQLSSVKNLDASPEVVWAIMAARRISPSLAPKIADGADLAETAAQVAARLAEEGQAAFVPKRLSREEWDKVWVNISDLLKKESLSKKEMTDLVDEIHRAYVEAISRLGAEYGSDIKLSEIARMERINYNKVPSFAQKIYDLQAGGQLSSSFGAKLDLGAVKGKGKKFDFVVRFVAPPRPAGKQSSVVLLKEGVRGIRETEDFASSGLAKLIDHWLKNGIKRDDLITMHHLLYGAAIRDLKKTEIPPLRIGRPEVGGYILTKEGLNLISERTLTAQKASALVKDIRSLRGQFRKKKISPDQFRQEALALISRAVQFEEIAKGANVSRLLEAAMSGTEKELLERLGIIIDTVKGVGGPKYARLPRELTPDFINRLKISAAVKAEAMAEVAKFNAQHADLGYTIGFRPPIPITKTLEQIDENTTQEVVRVWTSLSNVSPLHVQPMVGREYIEAIKRIPQFRVQFTFQKRLADNLEQLFRQEYSIQYAELASKITDPEQLKQAARELPRAEDARQRARYLYEALNEAARKEEAQGPPGLSLGGVMDALKKYFSRSEIEAIMKEYGDPRFLVLKTWVGSVKDVGLLPALTSRLKSRSILAATIANKIYPMYRFALDPFFQAQEWLEAYFWPVLRGKAKFGRHPFENPDPAYLALYSPLMRTLGMDVIFDAAGGSWVWTEKTLKGAIGITVPDIKLIKDRQMFVEFSQRHAANYEAYLQKNFPDIFELYLDAYGRDTRQVDRFMSFLRERMMLGGAGMKEGKVAFFVKKGDDVVDIDDVPIEELQRYMDPAGDVADLPKVAVTKLQLDDNAQETLVNALEYLARKSLEDAFETQYFNPNRGWLLRSFNHPFLGLYPLAYYWKVSKRLAEFLYKPFGGATIKGVWGFSVPFSGYEAYKRVNEALLAQAADDPENLLNVLGENGANMTFALDMLVPAWPHNLPIHVPAWARHMARANKGELNYQGIGDFIGRETVGAVTGFGLLRTIPLVAKSIEEIPQVIISVLDLDKRLDFAGQFFDASQEPPEIPAFREFGGKF